MSEESTSQTFWEALKERFLSPITGAFVFIWSISHWRLFLAAFSGSDDARARIDHVEVILRREDITTLLLLPFALALLFSLLHPLVLRLYKLAYAWLDVQESKGLHAIFDTFDPNGERIFPAMSKLGGRANVEILSLKREVSRGGDFRNQLVLKVIDPGTICDQIVDSLEEAEELLSILSMPDRASFIQSYQDYLIQQKLKGRP